MNDPSERKVIITDIRMPFVSMVVFMVKAAIAAIPAFIILAIIGAIFMGVMGGLATSSLN